MDDSTQPSDLAARWSTSTLASLNAPYLDQLFEAWLHDPGSIDVNWRRYFEGLPRANGADDVSHARVREHFRELARAPSAAVITPAAVIPVEQGHKQVKVLQLINAFRFRGHQVADLDPLGLRAREQVPELTLRHHGLTDADLDTVFETGSLVGPRQARLADILEIVQQTYCRSIGAEYMHITDTAEKRWLQSALEGVRGRPEYPAEIRAHLLDRLTAAEGLERFLHAKYAGQKRFSLEGGDALIPMLDELIQRAGGHGVREVVIGMAHRGRLNVLVNILGKRPADLFQEFEGRVKSEGTGDVKYHLGFSSDVRTPGGPVHVALAFNPSHLEIVGPVVEGSVRARQERLRDHQGRKVMSVILHGDAAFAGQGVVMETFNLSELRGYSTKGTVHIVINNQIGFTTSIAQDARSTYYCTDVAKMVGAPILHVNGDDPEAVLFAVQLAIDYRTTFRKDVVLDLICYRRHGHSEADEPTVTQPLMYQRIRERPTARERYARQLTGMGVVSEASVEERRQGYRQALEAGEPVATHVLPPEQGGQSHAVANWAPYLARECPVSTDTRVVVDRLRSLTERLITLPEGFDPHPHVAKVGENRRRMAAGALPIDWSCAETLAYATLLEDGFAVRLSGQDSGRGTFFHRHAILYSQRSGEAYVPLRNLFENQPNFVVINSPLSEEAVLAFEYGYATADPKTLVIWEAQFGDFANNAQVVIDQFISAGEQKWGRRCGLALFLPHGLEGQGPEHSSGRLERYLQLCAQHNMAVCVPTTPAQFYHLLRRQMHWACRKPLVVMTPKSLLRYRLAVSTLEDLSEGGFRELIGESDGYDPAATRHVVMCSGKVYYDLLEQRQDRQRTDVALIRIEQLYPFPEERLRAELARYPQARRFVWCQEEAQNQGAWFPSQHHLWQALPAGMRLEYAGRPMHAAPAVGSLALHLEQLHALVDQALGTVE
ncbi:MAG: 2-oxoglutarate dehydrogenase E1 component [Candidatus Muproteobacteria bacterium RBG_16_62_13]|uniref:2-oxoglutarate dehydrogenase E1 component n=1 Tax=Candidatus Muproteobacteria bacterium RBG_16_62_13 TaxID=1817756 RepID=A0A1F6T7W5_9PROT|nr:MAG: 2-oxoglutarate dehydrogenase E1 component [Candidatus Muproteobacteria bacterium RBG_16_62_13]